MLAVIKGNTIVLSGAPLEEPHRIRLGVAGPGFVVLCTRSGGTGFFVQDNEYAKVPAVARRLLEKGVSARRGEKNLTLKAEKWR